MNYTHIYTHFAIAFLLLAVACGPACLAGDGLWNPERGYRHEVLIGQEEDDAAIYRDNWPIAKYKSEGVTMVQGYCYLQRYYNCNISEAKLALLQADFDRAREEGVKYLLRFAYRNDASQPAPTLVQVLKHIEQLTPIVRKNIDVIYCLQIGWLGLWGEFHSDPYNLTTNAKAVASVTEATLRMLPENRSTMMRRMYYRDVAENNSPYVKKHIDRVGFFNDGTLANYTDAGTFLGTEKPLTEDEDAEFAKVCTESDHLPVDGESFWAGYGVYTRMNPYAALERFYKHHYTTFNFTHTNGDFDGEGPIEAWKETVFTARMLQYFGLPCDEGYFIDNPSPTAYDYIRDHLGYRLEMTSNTGSFINNCYQGCVSIRNVGTSRPINPRPIYAVLYDEAGHTYEYPLGIDARVFTPWEEVSINLDLTLPDDVIPSASLRVALWLPDEEESIRLRPEYAIAIARGVDVVEREGRRLNVLPSAEGSCSDDVRWRFDYATGTLVFKGSGAVPDYADPSDAPWEIYRESIQRVILTDNITALGCGTLAGCSQLSKVVATSQVPPAIAGGAIANIPDSIVVETLSPDAYADFIPGAVVRWVACLQEKYHYTGKPQQPVVMSDFRTTVHTDAMATEMGNYNSTAILTVEIEGVTYTYEIPFVYTIGRAAVYASTRDYSRAYGAANPKLYVNFKGGLDGDVAKELIGEMPVASCEAGPLAPVGEYAITVSGGTLLNDSLYEFVYLPSVLTVKEARLVVQADNVTRPMGEPNPSFTFTARGYVGGEDVSVFTILPTFVCEADEESAPGEYSIMPEGGLATNYTLLYKAGVLTVTTPESITATEVEYVSEGIFDVTGRRVENSFPQLVPGVYIINGKKVMKKQ